MNIVDGHELNHDKTVLITGSARRLGKEIALAIAAAGYSVIIHANQSLNEAEALVNQIINLGGKAKYICADFTDPEKTNEVFIKHLIMKAIYSL